MSLSGIRPLTAAKPMRVASLGYQGLFRLISNAVSLALVVCILLADTAQAAETRAYDIPTGPLSQSLNRFASESGITLSFEPTLVEGLSAPALSGEYSVSEGLQILLSQSGLEAVPGSQGGYRLREVATATAGEQVLAPITVEGTRESAYGPVAGYVATRSTAGSKTDTSIVEIPQSVSVVTADQVDTMGAWSVSEALRYTPGVDSEAFGYDARFNHFTVRGFQFDKFQFVDGMMFPAGGYAIPRIEPYGLERIELLRGPSSGLYGQNVPGGLVNLVSKRPTEDPIGEVQLGTGLPATIRGAFDFGGQVNQSRTLLYRLVGVANYGDTQIDHTTDQRAFLAPSFTLKPYEDTELTIHAQLQQDNVEGWSGTFLPMQGTLLPNPNGDIPTDTFIGEPGFDHYKRDQYSVGYEAEHHLSDAITLRSTARYVDLNVDAPNVYPDSLDPSGLRTLNRSALRFRDHVRNFTTDNNILTGFDLGPMRHALLIGFNYQWLHDRDRFEGGEQLLPAIDIFNPVYGATIPSFLQFSDNEIEQDRFGLYFQDQIRLDNWMLTLGGRQDWVSSETADKIAGGPAVETDDKAFTGRIGLSYLFDNGLAPYASYSTSFQPITGTTFEGTPFEPTTGEQFEAGIKFQPPGSELFLAGAVYQLTQKNVLTADTRPDAPPFSQIQEGESRVRGVELEAKASIWDGWDFIGSYTFAEPITTQSNNIVDGVAVQGKYVPTVPQHQASLWAKYTFDSGTLNGLGLGAGVRYRGSLYADNINRYEVPSVTLFDATLSYDLGKVAPQLSGSSLNINASNLFDRDYVANCDQGVCYYGVNRRVIVTFSYQW